MLQSLFHRCTEYRGLITMIMGGQVADVATTIVAIRHGAHEQNPLFNWLLHISPLLAYTLKLTMISAVTLLVLVRARDNQLTKALVFAAIISWFAPISNLSYV